MQFSGSLGAAASTPLVVRTQFISLGIVDASPIIVGTVDTEPISLGIVTTSAIELERVA